MHTDCQCRVELEGDTIVVTPKRDLGELDSELFCQDVENLLGLLAHNRARNLVIDLECTDFFGSDAICLFLRLHHQVQDAKGRMAFCHASSHEREVLSVTELDKLWPILSSREEAVDFVTRQNVDILVVDDSEVDRCLIGGLVRANPDYRVDFADGGKTALERIRESVPDLVITDLIMPGMNGLELVSELSELFPSVPVILLTAHGNEKIAFEALERGAASYVPKSRQTEKLLETIERVISRKKACHGRTPLRECPAKIDCTFYLDNDPARVRPTVDLIQYNLAAIGAGSNMDQIRIGIALEEALYNAIYHGNLEISEKEFAAARASNQAAAIEQLVSDRKRQDHFKDRRIVVDVHITSHTARFVIRDDGLGFDRRVVSRPATSCFELGENRGTMLMTALMDEVLYNEAGNQVTLIKIA
jgi:anti-anti-sigma factor